MGITHCEKALTEQHANTMPSRASKVKCLFFIVFIFDNECFTEAKIKRNSVFRLSFYSKVVLTLPRRGFAVLDSIDRTMVIAAHAHRAVAVPFRATFFESDIIQRACFHALAGMDASLGNAILAVVGSRAVETRIHQISLEPCQATHNHF